MKSKYKGVYFNESILKGKKLNRWQASTKIDGKMWNAYFEFEREAAIAYDKKMIELGKEPVNILVKK